jgi:Transcription factor WhiB
MTRPGRWQDQASCRGWVGANIWFSPRRCDVERAVSICSRCAVAGACLADALEQERHTSSVRLFGVRGGRTGGERTQIIATERLRHLTIDSAFASLRTAQGI